MGYTHGMKWNENTIRIEIKKTMDMLNIEHMPSRTEMKSALLNDALANKIARTGGFPFWANKLNIEEKESETRLGQSYEVKAMGLIEEKGFKIDRMTTKYPFDLLVNNNIKVDVKVGKPGDIRGSRVHTFRTAKKYATCDLYMIFALKEDEEIERLFIIPGSELKVVTLCIGRKSKYDKYINRWDLLKKYDNFYNNLASIGGRWYYDPFQTYGYWN